MASAKAASEPSMEEILDSIRQIIADEDDPDSETEEVKDQAAIDDVFDTADAGDDAGADMSKDDVDALFDAPAGAPEEENDQAAIDVAFDNIDTDAGEEMAADDVDALFDAPDAADTADAQTDEVAGAGEDEDVLALSEDQAIEASNDEDDISFDEVDDEELEVVPEPEVMAATASPAPQPSEASDTSILSNDAAGAVQSSFGALNSAMTLSSANTVEDLMKSMMRPMLKQWLDENLPETVERLVQAEIERLRNQYRDG